MANVSLFDISKGMPAILQTESMTPAAAVQQVPCKKDSRLCLRVCNANEQEDVVVRLKAGGGPRCVLGDKDITVKAGEVAYIALWDTARYKDLASGNVSVDLVDGNGDALSEQLLLLITIEAAQL